MPRHTPEDQARARQRRVQRADSRKALSTSRQMMRDSTSAMRTSRAAVERAGPAGPGRPPVILQLGPRDFSVLTWVRDEDGEPIYRVVKDRIKAASTAAVLARKLAEAKP
jgi:hypothetical protein